MAVENVETIEIDGGIVAIIVRARFGAHGVHFFTPGSFSQQLGHIQHAAGVIIQPHIHLPVKREVLHTNEVLIVKKGRLRVDLYTEGKEYRCSRIIESGDVILLVTGGHGFEVLEDVEMIEVKQGPFAGDTDKLCFPYDPAVLKADGAR